ncbi:hypothetical protein V500_10214, partial [Pseudogymnoascus sp. VKM F-4518 (FW-2643)]
MNRRDRTPERRSFKRKARELSPGDIGQELRKSRGETAPNTASYALCNLDHRFEYYNTRWNLRPGERILSYKEFKELAEEMNTTKIIVIHSEGMERHREEQPRKEYRMVKPTVKPTASSIPRGPRADSATSSISPWSSETPTPQPRERQKAMSSTVAQEPNPSPAPALETRVTRAPSNSQDTTPNVTIRAIKPRISPISATPVAAQPQPAVQKERVTERVSTASESAIVPEPKSTSSVSAPVKSKISSRLSSMVGASSIMGKPSSARVTTLQKSPQTQLEPRVEAKQAQPQPQTQPETQAQTKAQAQPQQQTQPETQAQTKTQPQLRQQTRLRTEAQTKTQTQSQKQTQPGTQAQTKTQAQLQQQTQPEQRVEAMQAEPQQQTQPKPQVEAMQAEPQRQTQPEAQVEATQPQQEQPQR